MTIEIPNEVYEVAALTLAAVAKPSKHGQLCPVWVRRAHNATTQECDCWILRNARFESAFVVREVWPLIEAEVLARVGVPDDPH